MASVRVVAAVFSGLSLAACGLPTPDYKVIQYPAPFRKEADGRVLDNENIVLDAQGYRVDKQGNRIGEVDIQAKTADEKSNAVAGFYISSQKATRARCRHGAERRRGGWRRLRSGQRHCDAVRHRARSGGERPAGAAGAAR